MTEVSTIRMYVLRAMYLMISVFIGSQIWPRLLHHDQPWTHMQGVANALLAALGLMTVIGIRYPLQMLPILLFEFAWKAIWLLAIAWPMYAADQPFDADMAATRKDCLFGVVVCLIAIPWRYVWANYVRKSGERWSRVSVP